MVDDRDENLIALEGVLASDEYRLIKANSGDEALRYLLTREPALILMDVQMPGMDGFETAALIKRSERTRTIPIIFITAINLDEKYAQKGYEHGAVDYIYKPFNPEILRSKVAVFAELAQKTKQLVQAERLLREKESVERQHQVAQLELHGLRREQAEQKKYRALVDGITHGVVWTANAETLWLNFVSRSSTRILGYGMKDCESEPNFFSSSIPPEDLPDFLRATSELVLTQQSVAIDHRFVRPDGKTIWLNTGLRIAKKEETGENEIHGLSVDITASREAAAVIQQDQIRSELLAEASLLLSESFDSEQILKRLARIFVPRLADWSFIQAVSEDGRTKVAEIAHSAPRDEATLGTILELFPLEHVLRTQDPEFHPELTQIQLRRLAKERKTHLPIDLHFQSFIRLPLVARGKTLGWIALAKKEFPASSADAYLGVVQDIARRIALSIDNANLYHQAQTAIRARDEFLSIASHELKTPLTPLKIQTQSLRRALGSDLSKIRPERVNKMLETSDRQIGRLSKLIDDLLDISRINAGKLFLSVEDFNATELIRDIVDRFSQQLAEAGCSLDLELEESVEVRWDRFRIEQVVVNLLTNAMKYGQSGKIVIRLKKLNDAVVFSIQDHGIGIAPEDQARIFGRFERAVSGNHFSGLGLGLYIVRQILETHHGAIRLESEPGKGSTFFVTLPLFLAEDEPIIHSLSNTVNP